MKKIAIANMKMQLVSNAERDRYLNWMGKELKKNKLDNCEIALCPSFVHLETFRSWRNKNKKVKLGAQNMFSEEKGSYTGEISPIMLKNYGAEYVIIGHSERRKYFKESNEEINLKIILAVKNGLKPILCVGETREEREEEKTLEVIENQLKESLADLSRSKIKEVVIAYEPIWAVGSDLTPTSHEIMEARLLIKKILVELFGKKYAKDVRIIYGGSVNSNTAEKTCVETGMDGALIGRESLMSHEFIKIAKIISTNQ